MIIKYQQTGIKLKFSIDKRAVYLSNFLPQHPTKLYYYKVLLANCNKISEQNWLDKSASGNLNRSCHSSPMNNVTNKIKQFPQSFILGPKIP